MSAINQAGVPHRALGGIRRHAVRHLPVSAHGRRHCGEDPPRRRERSLRNACLLGVLLRMRRLRPRLPLFAPSLFSGVFGRMGGMRQSATLGCPSFPALNDAMVVRTGALRCRHAKRRRFLLRRRHCGTSVLLPFPRATGTYYGHVHLGGNAAGMPPAGRRTAEKEGRTPRPRRKRAAMTSPFIIERVSDTQLLGMSAVLQVQDILSCRSWGDGRRRRRPRHPKRLRRGVVYGGPPQRARALRHVGMLRERHLVRATRWARGYRGPSLTHSVASARKPMLREVKRPTDWFLHRYYIGVPLISSFGDGKIAGSFIVGLPDKRHFNDAAVQMPDRVRAPARNAGGPRHAGALLQTAVRGEGYADASSWRPSDRPDARSPGSRPWRTSPVGTPRARRR